MRTREPPSRRCCFHFDSWTETARKEQALSGYWCLSSCSAQAGFGFGSGWKPESCSGKPEWKVALILKCMSATFEAALARSIARTAVGLGTELAGSEQVAASVEAVELDKTAVGKAAGTVENGHLFGPSVSTVS